MEQLKCLKIKNPDESNACLEKMHSEFPIEKSFINPETGNRIELSIHKTTGKNGEEIITATKTETTFEMPSRILKIDTTAFSTDSSKPNTSDTDKINASVLCKDLFILSLARTMYPEQSSLCEGFYKFYKIKL